MTAVEPRGRRGPSVWCTLRRSVRATTVEFGRRTWWALILAGRLQCGVPLADAPPARHPDRMPPPPGAAPSVDHAMFWELVHGARTARRRPGAAEGDGRRGR